MPRRPARRPRSLADAHRDLTDALVEGDVTAAATQFTDLYGDVINQANDAGLAVDEVTQFITGQADAVPSLTDGYVEFTDAQLGAINKYRQLGTAAGGYTAEELQAMEAQQEHNAALDETSDALADARGQYDEQGDVLHETDSILGDVAAGLSGAAGAEGELADGAAGSTEQLEAQRQGSAEAEAGAQAYADTLGSVDFQAAELAGATSAMSLYSQEMFAAGNEAQVSADAYRALAAAINENGTSFDTATEAGAANQDALEGLAAVVDNELAQAYDRADGDMASFMASAEGIRGQLVNRLTPELEGGAEAANAIADGLNLTDGEYEARFNLAGAEEARLKLQLLGSAIAGLPANIEQSVNQKIIAGDYVGALADMDAFYASNPGTVAVEADTTGYTDQVGEILEEVPNARVKLDADTAPAEDDIAAVEDAPHETTVDADADTVAAASELLDVTSKQRNALIRAVPQAGNAEYVLDNVADPRTSVITAIAHTGNAEAALNNTARSRTSHIYTVTHGGGGGGGGGASPSAAAAPTAGTSGARAAPVYSPNITINTAVIGDRYDVQRVVTRAVRGAVRIAGARLARRGPSR